MIPYVVVWPNLVINVTPETMPASETIGASYPHWVVLRQHGCPVVNPEIDERRCVSGRTRCAPTNIQYVAVVV